MTFRSILARLLWPKSNELPAKRCECFEDTGLWVSTHLTANGERCCDLCGWPVETPASNELPQSEREARQTTPVALPSDVMVFIGELQVERGCAAKKARRIQNRDTQINRVSK